MLLQTVEHEITDIERHSGEESKGCHDIVARQACVDAEIGEVTHLSQTDEQHNGCKVERDDECREKEQDEGYSKPNDGHPLGGEVVAAFDITFKDAEGKEIQPAGMVDVSFEGVVEDDSTMSVVHAVDGSTDKLETVPSNTEGESVKIQSDSFSPFLLTASTDEPGSNWTKGGGGIRDVSSQVSVQHNDTYRYWYGNYGFFNGDDDYPNNTFCLGMYVDGKLAGWSVCVDPLRDGRDMDGVWAGEVWQVSAPMFVKCMYYGPDGPRSDVIKSVTGYSDYGAINIIAHVAASEIYARLGYSSQSEVGDAFLAANGTLKNAVYKYVNAIADMDTPSGYYAYVTEKNGYSSYGYRHQNFAFGAFTLTNGSVKVQKVSSAPEMTNGNPLYSLEGARFWVYDTEAHARAKGNDGWMGHSSTMTTDANGVSNTVELAPGNYWLIEATAPRGFKLNPDPVPFTVTRGKTNTVTVSDVAANDPVAIIVNKACKDAVEGRKINSLEGTEFTVKYYNNHYDASTLPATATRTWILRTVQGNSGKYYAALMDNCLVSGSDALYKIGNTPVIPLGTITIEETVDGITVTDPQTGQTLIDGGAIVTDNLYLNRLFPRSASSGDIADSYVEMQENGLNFILGQSESIGIGYYSSSVPLPYMVFGAGSSPRTDGLGMIKRYANGIWIGDTVDRDKSEITRGTGLFVDTNSRKLYKYYNGVAAELADTSNVVAVFG